MISMTKLDKIRALVREKWTSLRDQGALHIFIGSFITKFVAFFASIFIVHLFSKPDYGVLGYVENIFGYVYLLAGLGLTNAALRYVIISEEEHKYSVYHYIIKRSTIYNVIIVLLAVIIFCWIYPFGEDFSRVRYLLPLLLISLPVHSLSDSGSMMLRSMFANKRYAVLSCLLGVSVLVFKYVFSLLWGLPGAFISNVTIYGFWAVYLLLTIHNAYFKGCRPTPLPAAERREINTYSLQFMITNGLWTVFMLNDVFLLGRITQNATLVADYKVAYAFPGNIALFSASIGIFVAPLFVKHEKEPAWVRKNYRLVLLATTVIIGAVSAVLAIWAGPIIKLVYGEEYLSVVPVMRVLLLAAFINNAFRYTNANLLSAMGRVKVNLYVSLMGTLLQVGINFLVIPRYGAMGVAYTSVLVYTLMAIAVSGAFLYYYFRKPDREPS